MVVDNNSQDETTKILKKYVEEANISFWKLNEMYNCYNMCGWKQRIFEFYGLGNVYLTVDSDELFIYKDYKNIKIDEFIKKEKLTSIKALMLDVYSKNKLYGGSLEDYKYVDKGTYKISLSSTYGKIFYGGPRSRILGINPSLQKIPLMKYTGKEVFANDHFYYPFNINKKAKFCSYLLHYEFLLEGKEKNETIASTGKSTFYDEKISLLIDNLDFN